MWPFKPKREDGYGVIIFYPKYFETIDQKIKRIQELLPHLSREEKKAIRKYPTKNIYAFVPEKVYSKVSRGLVRETFIRAGRNKDCGQCFYDGCCDGSLYLDGEEPVNKKNYFILEFLDEKNWEDVDV